jgi:hypothetical protein
LSHLKKHLSVANVLSGLALFMAMSGFAYAATLGRNAVKTRNIANGAVTTAKLRNNAVNTRKLRNNAVNARKVRNGAVTGPKISNEAVGTSKLANAAVRSTNLGGGVVTTPKLKNLGVTAGKLGNSAVTNDKIAAGSVETGKLANEAVTGEKVSADLYGQLVKNVSYETKATVTDEEFGSKEITATCPAGKVAIAGGARVTGAEAEGIRLVESFATDAGVDGKRTGWRARAESAAIVPKPWGVEAIAVCAEL